MNLAPLLLLSLAALLPSPAHAERFAFALIGDIPYTHFERQILPDLLDEIGREDLAFVTHDGDIKDGSSHCSDAVFTDIHRVFQASRHPLVFVPGDNEWTDCHRASNGGYDPLERLDRLRQIFFAGDGALGMRPLQLERQSAGKDFAEYRENVRWQIGRVLFVGLNVPGSNNNWGPARTPSPEHVARGSANHAWLAGSFARARAQKLAGILIVVQANPDLESAKRRGDRPNGYQAFLDQLRSETQAFAGQVVLVHGDTHFHRIDRPLKDAQTGVPLANFTRVETYGSPFIGWVKATVDDTDPQVFRFEARPYSAAGK